MEKGGGGRSQEADGCSCEVKDTQWTFPIQDCVAHPLVLALTLAPRKDPNLQHSL